MKPIKLSARAALGYPALACAMLLLNFALPCCEPLSVALLAASFAAGLNPYAAAAGYLFASVASMSADASLSAAVQAVFLLLIQILYARFGKKPGPERYAYTLLAQLPFLFLFPHPGYAVFPFAVEFQKLLIGVFFTLLSFFFEGGLKALLGRVFHAKLSPGERAELALMWLFLGMGAVYALGTPAFCLFSLIGLLYGTVLLKNASAVPLAMVLSSPLALCTASLVPVAEYAVYAAAALLLLPYGKTAAACTLPALFALFSYADGLFFEDAVTIGLTLAACTMPAILVICTPEKLLKKLDGKLLFYRERVLPRIAVNRSRRAVGEQLWEVSALFREIEHSFAAQDVPDGGDRLKDRLISMMCAICPNRTACEQNGLGGALDKLLAVGRAKGRVNLIDLPTELTARCSNVSGLLFALNDLLAEYGRLGEELAAAKKGRALLAGQARGISEILKNLALEQSAEFLFSDEERRLADALAGEGLIASEIFLYGDGEAFTATLTLESRTSAKKLVRICSEVLGRPLALAEKIPLTRDCACFVLRQRPVYDAAFGIAACTKEGEHMSGDTHSVLKIDERRFLVALSDGMGSGEEARAVSDRTLTLLESFYKAKMPSETVLATVNDLIAFSSDETFSCLDLAAVDLDTGMADVVKIGSPPGFVLSGETLQVLEGDSLPIGVLDAVRPTCLRIELKPDDFLLFMSDGVTGAFGSSSELCAYLSRLQPLNPQALAEDILKNALRRYRDRAEDDMTVVAVKLTKSA